MTTIARNLVAVSQTASRFRFRTAMLQGVASRDEILSRLA
jgi:hypothetical protein